MARAEDKTVLIVDDEPDVRNYLSMILGDAGFNVVTAADGVEALEIIREKRPDFISLDLVMPRKSGQKLLYELKKDRELARIPVLIVTAHAQTELGKKDLQDIMESRGWQLHDEQGALVLFRNDERTLTAERRMFTSHYLVSEVREERTSP